MVENISENTIAIFHERPNLHEERVLFPTVAFTALDAVIGAATQIALSTAFGWREHNGKLANIMRAEKKDIIGITIRGWSR